MLKNITKKQFNAWIFRVWKLTDKPSVFAMFDNHEEEAFAVVNGISVLKDEHSLLRVYNEQGDLVTVVEYDYVTEKMFDV